MWVDGFPDDAGLVDLVDLADLVLFGTVEVIERGVNVGRDPDVSAAALTIRVDETLRGEAERSVKVVLLTAVHGKPFVIPGQSVPAVGTSGVWMLARIGRDFDYNGYYPANPSGQILFDHRGRVTSRGGAKGLREAQQLGTRAKVLERMRD